MNRQLDLMDIIGIFMIGFSICGVVASTIMAVLGTIGVYHG